MQLRVRSLCRSIGVRRPSLTKMSCGRTKSEALVENVLAPFSQQRLAAELQKALYFAVCSDASNSGHTKLFPYTVQYFCASEGVKYGLLDFYDDSNESSEAIFKQIVSITENNGLSVSQISAYGADNASVNYGRHNSVFQKLREANPQIVKGNCKCHIINNTVKAANRVFSAGGCDVEAFVLKSADKFYGSKAKQILRSLLPQQQDQFRSLVDRFFEKAVLYLEDKFDFNDQVLAHIGCLSLHEGQSLQWSELEVLVEKLALDVEEDKLYGDVVILNEVLHTIPTDLTPDRKWAYFFSKATESTELLKVVAFVFSIPVSNAYAERVFSHMEDVWSDKRNRLSLAMVKSELQVLGCYTSGCGSGRGCYVKRVGSGLVWAKISVSVGYRVGCAVNNCVY
ncbi:hypothetical protein DPX16_17510 [Anabarilius grahami]|uniref:HAT C-terminal dimerisation domain-containing protein n=1 Tax=Anabarilius grahami TaxID=495550 RepID=A0A3N0XZ73_ANAGA|nr:hypothetical protein DPX16_17510 [Anabarilius grahami]